MELPRFEPLWNKYRDRGFRVIAIDSERDTERAIEFIEENDLTYTLVENLEGEEEVVERIFGVTVFPVFYLIDRGGRIRFAHEEFDEGEEGKLEEELQSLL